MVHHVGHECESCGPGIRVGGSSLSPSSARGVEDPINADCMEVYSLVCNDKPIKQSRLWALEICDVVRSQFDSGDVDFEKRYIVI